ncbi:transporter substrate-binding domain-containing protein [Neiella marina]|uniref:Transporter substrate-binding domain-containing protein n=1 Tax=Neiella holothuriorum TaxID=2870530 RepID=A0ABS7ELG9_9GAMM|nr:transporter substrate-binding domain-containing protein [Neiella holothuriorum]MBW8192461.1 transporter substrate-binding domain-containing protein [Neiella holothuriorum]
MNLPTRLLQLLVLVIGLVQGKTFANGEPANPRTLVLATHNLCPYGCFSAGADKTDMSQFRGIAVETVRCVLADIGWQLKLDVVPWARAQQLAKFNAVDGFFAASHKAERDEFAHMSAIIAEQRWDWYLMADSPLIPDSADFKRVAKVGGFDGSNMLTWLRSNNYMVASNPPDTGKLLKVLLAKRVDAVVANDKVMTELLVRRGVGQKVKSYPLVNKPLGVYFTHDFVAHNPGFLEQFNDHVELCRHD